MHYKNESYSMLGNWNLIPKDAGDEWKNWLRCCLCLLCCLLGEWQNKSDKNKEMYLMTISKTKKNFKQKARDKCKLLVFHIDSISKRGYGRTLETWVLHHHSFRWRCTDCSYDGWKERWPSCYKDLGKQRGRGWLIRSRSKGQRYGTIIDIIKLE